VRTQQCRGATVGGAPQARVADARMAQAHRVPHLVAPDAALWAGDVVDVDCDALLCASHVGVRAGVGTGVAGVPAPQLIASPVLHPGKDVGRRWAGDTGAGDDRDVEVGRPVLIPHRNERVLPRGGHRAADNNGPVRLQEDSVGGAGPARWKAGIRSWLRARASYLPPGLVAWPRDPRIQVALP